jgi:hypothetical protein
MNEKIWEVVTVGDIKCKVEECRYNKKQKCHADGIEVCSSGDMVVNTSDGTACETFMKLE